MDRDDNDTWTETVMHIEIQEYTCSNIDVEITILNETVMLKQRQSDRSK
jgi:hypothetical protein